ncbi:MAG: hypothetical protein K2X01_03465 [Cyanobacteria bacterium]|nr:hypothetical protein [Cyanobacteriota bacterium]
MLSKKYHYHSFNLITAFVLIAVAVCSAVLLTDSRCYADSAKEINASVDVALSRFKQDVHGGEAFLKGAKAVLVMPKVLKAGIGVGGEYGEGALRIHGKTVDYYKMLSASWGFQLGAQQKSVILVFMDTASLKRFRQSEGWKAGVDASVAMLKLGAGGDIDTNTLKQPVVGFVYGQKGLMVNLSLEGSKFHRVKKH